MVTNQHLRRMSRIELVQYGLEGDRQQRRAADELFRRFHAKYREKGLLDRKMELADPDAGDGADDMPDNVRSLI